MRSSFSSRSSRVPRAGSAASVAAGAEAQPPAPPPPPAAPPPVEAERPAASSSTAAPGNPFADSSVPSTQNPLARASSRALEAAPAPPNPFAAPGGGAPDTPVQLLPKPARSSRALPAKEGVTPVELSFPSPPAAAEGGGALDWVRSTAGAFAGSLSVGSGGGASGGGDARVPRGAGRSIEWGEPSSEGREEAGAEAREGDGDGEDDMAAHDWAATTPSAEAARVSRASDLALKKVLEWLTPLSMAASLCSALLGIAGIVAPWYGHTVEGDDPNCEIWYSQVSYGWEGPCSGATRAENPQFGAVNVAKLDDTFTMLSAAVISAFGVLFGFAAVAAAALQRASALRLGSPGYLPPASCGSACALILAASLEFGCTCLGALIAGARFEHLVNTTALVSIDTFGGGRSVADAAIALAAVAVVLALLMKMKLRKHAQMQKHAVDRRKAEQMLGLPAFRTRPCC